MSTETQTVFLARTKTIEDWKAVVGAISTLVDEATFEVKRDGIYFRGMDPSHIALIDMYWPNSAFEAFDCSAEQKFGIRVDEFTKIIKRGEKKDSCEISVGSDSMLHVKLMNGYKREYKLRMIETSESSTPLPKLNFNSKVKLTSAGFERILSDVQVVSEFLTLSTESGKASFSGKGDSGEANVVIEAGNEGMEDLSVKENSLATYSLDYLSKIVRAVVASSSSVVLEHSSKMPLRLQFSLAQVGTIAFYMAPRVQD